MSVVLFHLVAKSLATATAKVVPCHGLHGGQRIRGVASTKMIVNDVSSARKSLRCHEG